MRTQANLFNCCLLLVALSGASQAWSSESPRGDSDIVIDCAKPALPSQQRVGELVDQHNHGQVYATRARLMAEVRRACQRKGTAKILVQAPSRSRQQDIAARSPER